MSYGYLGNLKQQIKIICSECFEKYAETHAKCPRCGGKNHDYLKYAK